MTTRLKWVPEPAGHWVAGGFSERWPDSYFRIWPDYRGYHAKCVNTDSENDLGIFQTREEAMQRCHEYITPKPGGHPGTMKYKSSPPKPTRVRLLFES